MAVCLVLGTDLVMNIPAGCGVFPEVWLDIIAGDGVSTGVVGGKGLLRVISALQGVVVDAYAVLTMSWDGGTGIMLAVSLVGGGTAMVIAAFFISALWVVVVGADVVLAIPWVHGGIGLVGTGMDVPWVGGGTALASSIAGVISHCGGWWWV